MNSRSAKWLSGLFPLALLAIVLLGFLTLKPLSNLGSKAPPIEELTFQKVVLRDSPHSITVRVRNGGPSPVTIAQVLVDDAYWQHTISPERTVKRLGSATIKIPYPWVEGEAHSVALISATGVVFEHRIPVAVASPTANSKTLGFFALLGLFVGLVPVLIGLLWFPFVRTLATKWVDFLLALTAGLLVFLAIDAILEAFEATERVPGAFQGAGLIVLGIVAALAILFFVDALLRRRGGSDTSPMFVALLIAIGIGLHNLGEGLAIGAAYSLGELGLTTFLILGFTLHNVTEGLGIVAPLAKSRPNLWQLAGLGAIAGLPTVLGTWSGGLAYSATLSVFFLALGAGAIFQVVWSIAKLLRRHKGEGPSVAMGFLSGVVIMYATGLLVAS